MPPPPAAARRLGGASVACLALAAATPLTAGSTDAAFPMLFLAVGAVLLIFLVGCAAMIRRLPGPGALYTFVAHGLGRPLGVGAACLALVSYNAAQIGLYGLLGAAAAPLIDVPWWAVAAACWVVVAVGGMVHPQLTVGLVAVPVLGGIGLVAWGAADLLSAGPGPVAAEGWQPRQLLVGIVAFVGVETATAYAAEARRVSARPAGWAVLVLTILYAAASGTVSASRLPQWTAMLGHALVVAGLLAAMLALHHTVVRYLVVLGRERVLSAELAARRPASLTQSLTAGLFIGGGVLSGRSVETFGSRLVIGGSLGIVLLLTATSLAALLFLNRHPAGESVWRRFVAPAVSTVALGVLAYLAYVDFPVLTVAAGGVALLGALYGLALRFVRPVVYAGIGLDGAAVVVTPPSASVPRPRTPGAHRPERVNR
ncbi:APC family permease [Actinoplanes sp. NPDC051859]|uniref:APC family permease n=1 Tax=Actinoplanes sp. NPDC051859 TaxID=3363909 RepID=UPI00378C3248